MYLSKIAINAIDSYEQHQAIWSLFPGTPERKRDHLYRVEQPLNDHTVVALLQSNTEPQSATKATVLTSKIFQPTVTKGAQYRFKVLANPTKRFNASRKIVELKNENDQIEWLQKKLSGANVTVTSLENCFIHSKKSFNSCFVCFQGVLQVQTPERIEAALVMGIGRKKHAGAGLLSLARIH